MLLNLETFGLIKSNISQIKIKDSAPKNYYLDFATKKIEFYIFQKINYFLAKNG